MSMSDGVSKEDTLTLSIGKSVGKGEKAVNNVADLWVVQILLNRFILAGVLPSNFPLLPLPYASDSLIKAIEDFQHDIMGQNNPDGRVDPDGNTMKRLNGPVPSDLDPVPKTTKGVEPPSPPNTAGTESFSFPFSKSPGLHWTGGSRFFGAKRGKNKDRRHAGCDLVFPRGTNIYAIADGTRVRGPYTFTSPKSDPPYPYSDAVEIKHGPILVRYGEIETGSYSGGDEVKQGDLIAKVGALKMLHFEVYTNAENRDSLSSKVMPFKRRGDLTNPDLYLSLWLKNLPKALG